MATIKRKTRKKLTKQLAKLVKRHGPEMALALVSGIVSTLATEAAAKPQKKKEKNAVPRPPKIPKKGVIVTSPR